MKTATTVTLPDDARAVLLQAMHEQERAWRVSAQVADALIDDGAPAMATYQAVAAVVAVEASTVRSWVDMRRAVGDELLDELPFGIRHWRLIRQIAGATGREVRDVALEEAATADAFGGLVTPVDRLRAKARGRREKRNPYLAALDREESAALSAYRHAPDAQAREAAAVRVAAVQDARERTRTGAR